MRQEYAEEEAEVAELEAAEKAAALEVPLSLRITREPMPNSSGARPPNRYRFRRWSVGFSARCFHSGEGPVLTIEQVEEIARRVMRETA